MKTALRGGFFCVICCRAACPPRAFVPLCSTGTFRPPRWLHEVLVVVVGAGACRQPAKCGASLNAAPYKGCLRLLGMLCGPMPTSARTTNGSLSIDGGAMWASPPTKYWEDFGHIVGRGVGTPPYVFCPAHFTHFSFTQKFLRFFVHFALFLLDFFPSIGYDIRGL